MMKKLNLTKLNLVLLIALALILVSCDGSNKANVDRAIGVFFLGVLQVLNIISFGSASVALCVVSATNPKEIYKILGWMFLGIFTIFILLGLNAILRLGPKNGDVFMLFIIEAVMMFISLIFVLKKPNQKTQQTIQENKNDTIITKTDDIDEII